MDKVWSREQLLDYVGEVYHDSNGVTYLHFRARDSWGDGSLICLPKDLFQLEVPLEVGHVVVLHLERV